MKKILTATDGSLESERALMQAAELASKFQASLEILTVIPNITPMASPIDGYPYQYLMQDTEEVREYYRKILGHSAKEVKSLYPNMTVNTHLKSGRPSKEIIDMAEEIECGMVVLGSRGIGGITGWVLGSTSKKVVDGCKRNILVVK